MTQPTDPQGGETEPQIKSGLGPFADKELADMLERHGARLEKVAEEKGEEKLERFRRFEELRGKIKAIIQTTSIGMEASSTTASEARILTEGPVLMAGIATNTGSSFSSVLESMVYYYVSNGAMSKKYPKDTKLTAAQASKLIGISIYGHFSITDEATHISSRTPGLPLGLVVDPESMLVLDGYVVGPDDERFAAIGVVDALADRANHITYEDLHQS